MEKDQTKTQENLSRVIEKCKAGDKDAFRALISFVEKKSLHTAFLICHDHNLAEDILQETYIDCFNKIHTLKNTKAFKSWFYKILVRNSWKLAKDHRKNISHTLDESYIDQVEPVHKSNSVQDNHLMDSELNRTLMLQIHKLSPKVKTAVILFYFNELSIDEISRIQGSLTATTKTRLYYGRQQLKTLLTPYVKDDDADKSQSQKEVHQ